MNNKNIDLSYWNYFLALEADLASISRFIEFSPANFKTFSIELAHLLLATASEIDVVAKQICSIVAPSQPATNIDHYRNILKTQCAEVVDTSVYIPRHRLEIMPWKEWSKDNTPQWWSDHNKVKHDRSKNFDKANLENVLNAIAGLFVLLLFFYRRQSIDTILDPVPILFSAPNTLSRRDLFLGGYIAMHFK